MDDGLWVPGGHDGMAAFPGPNGKTLLVRNHELQATSKTVGPFGWNNEKIEPAAIDKFYDAGSGELPCLGGTTTLIYDTQTQTLRETFPKSDRNDPELCGRSHALEYVDHL